MEYESMFKPDNVAVYDPIIEAAPKKMFAVLKGGVETTEREFVSSTYSNSSTQFSVPPPNPSTFVSRRFMLRQPVSIRVSGATTVNQQLIYQTGYSAFRQAPLASIMQTLDITLNGQSVSLSMNDVIKPLLLFHNNERDLNEREMSLSPMMRDQSQQYSDLAGTNSSNRNPLEGFPNAEPRGQQGRGAFPYVSFDDTNPNDLIIQADLCEELYLSPLLFGGVRDEGFIGLQKIEINITWDNNLDKIWSHTPSPNELSYDISVTLEQPSILFRYVTPPLNFAMPPFMQYDYNEIQRYPTNYGDVAADGTASIVSNNIQLNSIPRFIYLFARQRNADFTYDDTDSYMSIEQVQINWNNNNSLLSNASQQQLYDIARKNGVDLAWNEWSGIPTYYAAGTENTPISGIGSVLSLEFGTDIGLREDEAPGMIGTYNLQTVMQVRNRSDHTQNITGYIITIIPGIFTIYQNSASKRIGILSKEDVLAAKPRTQVGYYDLMKGLKCGGFLKGKARKLLRTVIRHAPKVLRKAAPLIKPYLSSIPQGDRLYELGIQGADYLKKKQKKKRKKRLAKRAPKKGAALTGGLKAMKQLAMLKKKYNQLKRLKRKAKAVKRAVKGKRGRKRGGAVMTKGELANILRSM